MKSNNLTQALASVNASHPYINHGGCGSFARLLGRYLTQMGHQVQYIPIYRTEKGLIEGNEFANNSEHFAWMHTSWCHIMIKTKGKLIDSQGIFNKLSDKGGSYYEMYEGEPLTLKMLNKLLSPEMKHQWNHRFNRASMGGIAKKLKNCLEL